MTLAGVGYNGKTDSSPPPGSLSVLWKAGQIYRCPEALMWPEIAVPFLITRKLKQSRVNSSRHLLRFLINALISCRTP